MPTSSWDLERQIKFAAVFVVAVGYAITFVPPLTQVYYPFTTLQVVVCVLLGLLYTVLLLNDAEIIAAFPIRHAEIIYLIVQLVIVITVQIIAGGSGLIWLISIPLVGTIIEFLSPLWRWVVYLLLLASAFVPAGLRTGNWEFATSITLSFATAMLFVIVFMRLALSAEQAREQAEQLAVKLEGANRRLAAYAAQVEQLATTKERNRLAREIHDSLGHYLTVVNVQIGAARAVMEDNPQRALDALEKAQTLTQEGLATVRQSVAALRESPTRDRPLPEVLSSLLEETRSAGIQADLEIQGTPRILDSKTELALYRVAQEGLTNVRKHAQASRVDVTLDYRHAGKVQLQIKDDGVGTAVPDQGGFGLLGIDERIKLLQGEVAIDTAPGQGLTLHVIVPG